MHPRTSVISSPIYIPKGLVISLAPCSFKITLYSSSSINIKRLPPFFMNEIMDDFSSGLIGFWVFLARGEIFTSVLTLSRDLDVIVLFISEYSAPISLHMALYRGKT